MSEVKKGSVKELEHLLADTFMDWRFKIEEEYRLPSPETYDKPFITIPIPDTIKMTFSDKVPEEFIYKTIRFQRSHFIIGGHPYSFWLKQ